MHPMLAALHKKMKEKEDGHPDLMIEIGHEDQDDKHGNDDVAGPAPELEHSLDHGHDEMHETPAEMQAEDAAGIHDEHEGDPSKYEGSPMHMAILKGLGSQHSSASSGSPSLRSKASGTIQEKMAEIAKKKKGY